jgi:Zn-dependent M28 family amino/carboxypeptidase
VARAVATRLPAGLIAFVGIVAALLVAIGVALVVITQPVMSTPPHGVTGRAEPARLERHVRTLVAEFAPRDWTHADNLDRAATWLIDEYRKAGGRASEQTYLAVRRPYRNVIASFGPTEGPRIIVGAHYDGYEIFPAADDNASGVAGLLELARLLGATETLRRRVDLVGFTLEEPPFYRTEWMGSRVHAASLKNEGVAVRAMICLEMIGYFSDKPDSQDLPHPLLRLFYPSKANFIAVVGRIGDGRLVRQVKSAMRGATNLGVYSMNAPTWVAGVDFSDHRSYWAFGYPAVMVTDTAFYRNDHYHTARDTPDTLDYRRMAKVVEGVYQAVLMLSR